MKVSVVIPNWNGADFIVDALDSLKNQSYDHKVIVVDNGSKDESVELIKNRFPYIKLICLPRNIGFSGGVNTGIEQALRNGSDAIALFNNDASASKHWLKYLVKSLEKDQSIGIVTGKFVLADKKHLDSTGDYYSVWGMPFPRGRNQKDVGQYDTAEEIFAATGGASLYRSEMLKKIGVFDDAFFAYYEDVDISFRAQLAGWKVYYEPKAVAYHKLSSTSSKLGSFTRYHATKNFFLLYAKNMPVRLYIKYLPKFLLQSLRLAVSSLLKGGGWPFIQGFLRALLLTPYIARERRRVQALRKVPTRHIEQMLYKKRPPKIPTI